MRLSFSGSRALILGGSSDLGLALAERMIREELFPFLTYRNTKGLKRITDRLGKFEKSYRTACFDLGIPDSAVSLFEDLNQDLDYMVDLAQGDFEGLVSSAGSGDVEQYFSDNISARARMIKMAGRAMLRQKKGRIVFVSSAAAGKPNAGQGFYAASKLASEALYRNLGLEMEGRGITTVSLRLGYVDAGRGRRYLQDRGERFSRKETEVLSVKEAAAHILFFLSERAAAFNAIEISMGKSLRERLSDYHDGCFS